MTHRNLTWMPLCSALLFGGTALAQDLAEVDRTFLEKAAQNGHAEVSAGRLALTKARDPKVRDYAQRRVGHQVLWAMLVGCVISWYMATPQLALASAAAFAMGELGDWALFTFTNRPFSQRILISSLVGAPLDSVVFLLIIGLATPWSIITMSVSKLLGALLVFWLVRRREQREYAMGLES